MRRGALYRFFALLLLVSFLGLSSGIAQRILGFHFRKENRRKQRFQFELHNNLIVLPIRVNGIDTLNFVLDTGVSNTLITDPSIKDSLNLPCLREIDVAGAGRGAVLKGCISLVNEIRFRGIQSQNHGVIILQKDVLELSSYAGVKIHGIIGYDLFSRFIVEIDYSAQIITFYNPERYRYRRRVRYFPVEIEQQKPYLHAKVKVGKQGKTPVKLLLDIGAGHSLSLDVGSHPDIQVPERNLATHLGMTLNGAVKGSIARVEELSIGKFSWEKVICSFPDSLSLRYVKQQNDRQGNLGVGILKRFRLVLDYPHEKVGLKRNRFYKEPFNLNTSGIELASKAPEFRDYIVSYVRQDSPAYKLGLQKGDIIVAVDNILASSMPLNVLYDKINKKPQEQVLLFVRRQDQFYLLELKLESPI